MAPNSTIYLTRHAQAEHNVDLDYSSKSTHPQPSNIFATDTSTSSVLDAPLTKLGRKQAASLAPLIPHLQDKVELIITSPLKRTLQTTLLGWGPAIQRLGITNAICHPAAQECNDFPCDTGVSREELEQISEFAGFNFDRLTPDWISKAGFYSADREAIARRAQAVRQFIRDQPEKEIVLVAHGDFLRQITADARGPSDVRGSDRRRTDVFDSG